MSVTRLTNQEKRDMQDKISLGIRMLNVKVPGWRKRIRDHIRRENRLLDMWSPTQCVLGKLFGDFSVGVFELDRSGRVDFSDWGLKITLKTTKNAVKSQQNYRFLAKCWNEEIYRRTQKGRRDEINAERKRTT